MKKEDAYMNLAFAIVEKAIIDFRKAKAQLERKPNDKEARCEIAEINEFFKSELFLYFSDFNEDLKRAARKEEIAL